MKYPKKYANYVVYYLACLGVLLVSVLCSRNATLKQAFKDQFFIGTALNVHQIFGQDESVAKIIDEQFNSITCG